MSNPVDFSVKPFARGVLKDIPSQFMPMGGLTHGLGVRIDDAYIERRKGFRRVSDCEWDNYILGIVQYVDPYQIPHVFFGDRYYLYHIGYTDMRYWDDAYPWWDVPGHIWDCMEGGIYYQLSPWGATQVCPTSSSSSYSAPASPSTSTSPSASPSVSPSVSPSPTPASSSSSSSESCTLDVYPFTGRDHMDSNGETSTWIFTNFAGNIIATNYDDPIVLIRGYAYDRYENLNCMGLHARIVDNFQNHLMALNTIDTIDGMVVNRIWWSGLDDAEDWDYTSLASESGFVDLEPSSMPITGGAKLRDSYIVYQGNMIHQLNYVGGTNIFSRQVINNEIGCLTKGLLCGDGDKHFFFAQNDIWMFDGYNFKPIGINNNEYIYKGLNKAQMSRAFSFIDTNTNEAHFFIPWYSDIPNLDCIYDFIHDLWTFDLVEATAGCPKVAFDFPYIARVGEAVSSSSSCSSSSSFSLTPCPTACPDCQDIYLLTISGVGSTCEGFDCSELNGTHDLYQITNGLEYCEWYGYTNNFIISLTCENGYWVIDVEAAKQGYGRQSCISWQTPNIDGCPPEGDDIIWTVYVTQGCCSGGTVYLEPGSISASATPSPSDSPSPSPTPTPSPASYSFSETTVNANSLIQEVGSTDNDDGAARTSEWISGEYTTFTPDVPIDQYIKEIQEITPVVVELVNDVHLSIGSRDRTDTTTVINWESLAAFTDQELVGTRTYGRYLSFKCIASSLNDYYRISEIMGMYIVAGRR